MPVSEKEIYQSAHAVMGHYGDRAAAHAHERLAALRTAGDDLGVATWSRVAAAIEVIRNQDPDTVQ